MRGIVGPQLLGCENGSDMSGKGGGKEEVPVRAGIEGCQNLAL